MQLNIITLFPEVFTAYLDASIPGRAAAAGKVNYRLVQLRDFTHDRHRTVDDYPYGGGSGMVLRPEPFFEAVESLAPDCRQGPIVLLSARGKRFSHDDAVRLSLSSSLTLLCGHDKDVDQRVADHLATEELSIGDFVLSGGEPAAIVLVDAIVRLLPEALGSETSAENDSFSDGLLDCPHYTRPAEFRGMKVPEVLLNGNHAEIEKWRREKALEKTKLTRKDLLEGENGDM